MSENKQLRTEAIKYNYQIRYQHLQGWDYLNALANHYYQFKVNTGAGSNWENRSSEQISIANEIIEKTLPYIHQIGRSLLFGRKYNHLHRGMKLKIGNKPVSLKEPNLNQNDLVQNAVKMIIENFDNYNPNKGKIQGWIKSYSICAMLDEAVKNTSLVRLYSELYYQQRKKIKSQESKKEYVLNGEEDIKNEISRALLYSAITHDYQRICSLEELEDLKVLNLDLIANEDQNNLEESVQKRLDLSDTVEAILKSLKANEEEVLKLRYGIGKAKANKIPTFQKIAEMFGVTRQRVHFIESEALKKLNGSITRRELENYI